MTRTYLALALVATALLSGCSGLRHIEQNEAAAEANKETAQRLEPGTVKRDTGPTPLVENDGVWLGAEKREEQQTTPAELRRTYEVNRTFHSVVEVAERISLTTDIPVSVAPEAISNLLLQELSDSGFRERQEQQEPGGLAFPPGGTRARVPELTPEERARRFDADYAGSLAGFLDAVSARYNVSWRYRRGRIEIYRYQQRTFVVEALPGTSATETSIEGTAAGNSERTSGQAQMAASFKSAQQNIWLALETSVAAQLTDGGQVTVSPALGTITVRDVPRVLEDVSRYIEHQNAHLGKQVAVSVTVLTVDTTRNDNYGVNWDLVAESLSDEYGASFVSNTGLDDVNGGLLNLRILQNGEELASGETVSGQGSDFQGTKAMIEALSRQSKVSVETSTTVTTLNNQPVPIRNGNTVTFLEESQTTIPNDPNIPAQTSLTPGTIQTGFSLNLTPHIQADSRVLLEYGVSLTEIEQIGQISSNNSTIQTPETSSREFVQRTGLQDGQTLVLAGFEQALRRGEREGVGDPRNIAAGNAQGDNEDAMVVILIRPTILSRSNR